MIGSSAFTWRRRIAASALKPSLRAGDAAPATGPPALQPDKDGQRGGEAGEDGPHWTGCRELVVSF